MSEWLQTTEGVTRCWWPGDDPEYIRYHDDEWGQPTTDDTRLFEKICLEGFQSGLSWITILRKRDNFRAAFDHFDIATVAAYNGHDVDRLLGDAGIVRHRGKIESTSTTPTVPWTSAPSSGRSPPTSGPSNQPNPRATPTAMLQWPRPHPPRLV